jgi:hypothetical protein
MGTGRPLIILLLTLTMITNHLASADEERTATVGMTIEIRDLVLPGSELVTRPIGVKDPFVLRISATYPHGTSFRYDLECYGLEPGEYDIADWLLRRDGSSTDDLPPTMVTIRAALPPGQVLPHRPAEGDVSVFGGYGTLLVLLGVVWLIALPLIIFYRRDRGGRGGVGVEERPLTLAERLRPMVLDAIRGTLTRKQRSQLELTLLAYWRRKLDLEGMAPAAALASLKQHPEAGPLLAALEEWLHHPAKQEETDLEKLLNPYRDLPADALEEAKN